MFSPASKKVLEDSKQTHMLVITFPSAPKTSVSSRLLPFVLPRSLRKREKINSKKIKYKLYNNYKNKKKKKKN